MNGGGDRYAAARAVADAVLYEGYVLYPYRASSAKNRVRWQFGLLTPRAFSEADGSERWWARTECLVDPGLSPVLDVRVRCLQVQQRTVEAWMPESQSFASVDRLEVDGETFVDWEEAVEQIVDLQPVHLSPNGTAHREESFAFAGGEDIEAVRSAGGTVLGRVARRRLRLDGQARVTASCVGERHQYLKVSVTVDNTTPWPGASARRAEVVGHSLAAVHLLLAVDGGRFLSLFDPPADAVEAVAGCDNQGAFPVLIGEDDVMLASPIILYDHPEVAPESQGDLYDATEIDEILALRVLTLTDSEKAEARGTDPRAAAIIDRCGDMPTDVWERLHGAVRSLRPGAVADPLLSSVGDRAQATPWWDPAADASVDPWSDSVSIAGTRVAKGASVRLRPSHRSDAQDLFLHGLTATVAGVFRDVDGGDQVAVTVDDDPASEELEWQGRYLFFRPDEVEPLPGGREAS